MIDSLRSVLKLQKDDTGKVNTINALTTLKIDQTDSTEVAFLIDRAITISKKNDFRKGELSALKNLIRLYGLRGEYENAVAQAMKLLQLSEKIKDRKEIAAAYFGIGVNYSFMSNYPVALKNLFLSLQNSEELRDSANIINTLIEIGRAFNYQGDYANERKHNLNAIRYVNRPLPDSIYSRYNLSIAYALFRIGDYKTAYDWLNRIQQYHYKIGDTKGLAHDFTQLAYIFDRWCDSMMVLKDVKQGKEYYSKSLWNFEKAVDYFKKVTNCTTTGKGNLGAIYGDLGSFRMKHKFFKEARSCFEKSLELSKETGWFENIAKAYHNLYLLDSTDGNFKKALSNFKLSVLYADSSVNREILAKSENVKLEYEASKRQGEIEVLSAQNKMQTALAKQQAQRKNFAYLGIGFIVLAGGYGFYRFRKIKALQNQQALMNERLRISRELHDEVGATLSGIAMYSHLTKEQIKIGSTVEVAQSLNIMQQSAGEMINKLNDIVWLVSPDNDSLKRLLLRLEEYATDMAIIKSMQVKMTVPVPFIEHELPVEHRRNIYLFCKEAINNAVKYSDGDLLELNVKQNGSILVFFVVDNGRGFDPQKTKRGNGLRNMQQRANEMNAVLKVQSNEHGSSLSLQYKIT